MLEGNTFSDRPPWSTTTSLWLLRFEQAPQHSCHTEIRSYVVSLSAPPSSKASCLGPAWICKSRIMRKGKSTSRTSTGILRMKRISPAIASRHSLPSWTLRVPTAVPHSLRFPGTGPPPTRDGATIWIAMRVCSPLDLYRVVLYTGRIFRAQGKAFSKHCMLACRCPVVRR